MRRNTALESHFCCHERVGFVDSDEIFRPVFGLRAEAAEEGVERRPFILFAEIVSEILCFFNCKFLWVGEGLPLR
jgi:hypothetical protein